MKKCFQVIDCGKQHPIMFIVIKSFDLSLVSSAEIIISQKNNNARLLKDLMSLETKSTGLNLVPYNLHQLIGVANQASLRHVSKFFCRTFPENQLIVSQNIWNFLSHLIAKISQRLTLGLKCLTLVLFSNFQPMDTILLIFNMNAEDIFWKVIILWTFMQLIMIMTNLDHIAVSVAWYQEKDFTSVNSYHSLSLKSLLKASLVGKCFENRSHFVSPMLHFLYRLLWNFIAHGKYWKERVSFF